MDLVSLKNFLIVADTLSISQAAEIIKITQPALSRQMSLLEKKLQVKLFVRSTRQLELTKDGLLFRRRAEEILELCNITINELSAKSDNDVVGNINIGMGDLKSVKFIPKLIRAFKEKYPLVSFSLYTMTADISMERLERGLLDIGILMEPISLGKFDFISLPVKEELGILMRPDDDMASRDYIRPVDLRNKPLIVAGHKAAKKQIERWFSRYEDTMNIVFRTNLPTSSAILVGDGLGYAFLVGGAVEYWDPKLFVYKPLKPPIEYTSVLAWKKNQPHNLAVEKFLEFCQIWFENQENFKI